MRLYQYFFYGWLFRDADSGTSLERSAALRHNVDQARWLPAYLLRWSVAGTTILALEATAEFFWGDSALSAMLAVLFIGVVMFLLVTCICWLFLQAKRQSR